MVTRREFVHGTAFSIALALASQSRLLLAQPGILESGAFHVRRRQQITHFKD